MVILTCLTNMNRQIKPYHIHEDLDECNTRIHLTTCMTLHHIRFATRSSLVEMRVQFCNLR